MLHEERAKVEQAQEVVEHWLEGVGLHLSPTKTQIVHTLQTGFDFLGKVQKNVTKENLSSEWSRAQNQEPIGFLMDKATTLQRGCPHVNPSWSYPILVPDGQQGQQTG